MKHAVITLQPNAVLLVTNLPPKDAVAVALIGRETPDFIYVCEVDDDARVGDTIPDDAPVVWCYSSLRYRRENANARA